MKNISFQKENLCINSLNAPKREIAHYSTLKEYETLTETHDTSLMVVLVQSNKQAAQPVNLNYI